MTTSKTCTRCGETKPLDAFGIEHASLDRPHVLGAFVLAARRRRLAESLL
jgi:hypothetical protein